MTNADSGVFERYNLYIDQAIQAAKFARQEVFLKNNWGLEPQSLDGLFPIPVYEDGYYSLLSHAKEVVGEDEVEITWPDGSYEYLPAYFRRFTKSDGTSKMTIVINETENYCEARFYAAKELMHCYVYDNKEAVTGTIEQADSLLMQLAYRDGNPKADTHDPQTIADNAAYYGAFEYLVPPEWHAHIKKIFNELLKEYSEEDSRRFIAQKIRVPIRLVALVIGSNT